MMANSSALYVWNNRLNYMYEIISKTNRTILKICLPIVVMSLNCDKLSAQNTL